MSCLIREVSVAQISRWNVCQMETGTTHAESRSVRCGCAESNARTSQGRPVSRRERSSCTASNWDSRCRDRAAACGFPRRMKRGCGTGAVSRRVESALCAAGYSTSQPGEERENSAPLSAGTNTGMGSGEKKPCFMGGKLSVRTAGRFSTRSTRRKHGGGIAAASAISMPAMGGREMRIHKNIIRREVWKVETVIALAQVFLLVFIIVVGAWFLGLGLCRMADDENDDEQQMEWIRAQVEKNRRKKEQKTERARRKRR